jgi:small-conductance mechanosensitive channel
MKNTADISARMRRFVTFLFFAALVLVLLERFSANTIWVVRSDFAPDAVRALAYQAISAIPEGMFLLGLWWVRAALAAFARGELFAPPITRMLERVGVVIACGAAVRIAVVPAAAHLLGMAVGYWIAFDAASMVLAALGLALKAIAAVLRQALVIQSELDEIF